MGSHRVCRGYGISWSLLWVAVQFSLCQGILGYSKVMTVILCNFATHILVHISILITILFLILHLLTFYSTQYLFHMILIFNSVS